MPRRNRKCISIGTLFLRVIDRRKQLDLKINEPQEHWTTKQTNGSILISALSSDLFLRQPDVADLENWTNKEVLIEDMARYYDYEADDFFFLTVLDQAESFSDW